MVNHKRLAFALLFAISFTFVVAYAPKVRAALTLVWDNSGGCSSNCGATNGYQATEYGSGSTGFYAINWNSTSTITYVDLMENNQGAPATTTLEIVDNYPSPHITYTSANVVVPASASDQIVQYPVSFTPQNANDCTVGYCGIYVYYTLSPISNGFKFVTQPGGVGIWSQGFTGQLASNSVVWQNPQSSSTTDFANWIVNASVVNPGDYLLRVDYSNNTSTPRLYSDANEFNIPDTSVHSLILQKSISLSVGSTYTAVATLSQDLGNGLYSPVASSSISFTVTAPFTYASGGTSAPNSTSTSLSLSCDPSSGAFAYSLCNLAQYLFIPDSAVIGDYQGLLTTYQTKPPFAYFSAVQSALNDFNDNATPAFSLADASSTDTYVFTPLDTGLQWILWVMAGIYVFKRVTRLEL